MANIKRRSCLSFILCFLCLSQMSANSLESITGRVIDANSGKAIQSVTVTFLYSNSVEQRVLTDNEGKFVYSPKHQDVKGYQVVFSHVSYEERKVLVKEIGKGIIRLSLKSSVLEEFVLTTTRTSKKIDELPVPIQLISSGDIKKIAPMSVQDILYYSIPGIEMSEHGGITQISIQGYDADYFAFLVDGEEVSGLKSGSIDLMRLSPENIERVEVVRGAGSALYGSSAVGGVINFITKTSKKPTSGFVVAGYTMPKQWTSYGELGFNRETWSNTTSLSADREGDYMIKSRNEEAQYRRVRNDVYRASNRFTWKPNERFTLRNYLGASSRLQHRNVYQQDQYSYFNGRLTGAYQLTDRSVLTGSYDADFSVRIRHFPKAGSKEIQHENLKQVARVQYDLALRDKSELNVGLEGHSEYLISSQIRGSEKPKSILYGVIYGQYLRPLMQGLDLLVGLRVDLHSAYGLNLSPKAILSYRNSGWMMRLGYARAFKSPSMMELYYDWSHQGMFEIFGNPHLKPETANQFLLGLEYKNSFIRASVGGNYTIFKNKIGMITDTDNNQQHINFEGSTKMFVTDAQLECFITNGVSVKMSYAFSHSPQMYEYEGKEYNVSMIRPHNVMAQLNGYKQWSKWGASASLIGQYLSGISSYAPNSETSEMEQYKVDGYPMVRLNISGNYMQKYTLTLGVDNLLNFKPTNLTYQTGSFSPGAVLFGKVSVQIP